MTAVDAFDRDVRRWVCRFYVERERLAAERSRMAAGRLFDRERIVLYVLTAQLMAWIALLPWSGAGGVLVGLTILYVGSILSGAVVLKREGRLLRRRTRETVEAEGAAVADACPPLDADARAILIRLMNLTDARPTDRAVAMIRAELRDALASPPLASWRFLGDVAQALDQSSDQPRGRLRALTAD